MERETVELPAQLDLLEARYGPLEPAVPRSALEWVLWENVAHLVPDEKRLLAFTALRLATGFEPARILALSPERLLAVAALGGAHAEKRTARLTAIARRVQQELRGDLERVRSLDAAEAERVLRGFPGIGEAEAHRILLFLGAHTLPALEQGGVRVLMRLGHATEAASDEASYRAARRALEPFAARGPAWLVRAHELLRRHALELCRRTDPDCASCPLAASCPAAW